MASALMRYASPQAWRRLRNALSITEREDVARDIASYIAEHKEAQTETELADIIARALTSVPWDMRKQA